jgi:hypothetical protein
MLMHGFAVVPDDEKRAMAMFADLEQAIEWGLATYGSDAFAVRYLAVECVETGSPVLSGPSQAS